MRGFLIIGNVGVSLMVEDTCLQDGLISSECTHEYISSLRSLVDILMYAFDNENHTEQLSEY